MARPKKQGLDYFPFDCDFFSDERMVAIAGKYGIEGEIVTVKLLCAIYRRGYYLEWNEMVKYKLLSQLPGVGASRLDEIVTRLVLWGFFDKALYDSDNVLTSKSIQEVYFEASKFRKLDGELPYLLEKPRVNYASKEVSQTLTPISQKQNKAVSQTLTPISQKQNKAVSQTLTADSQTLTNEYQEKMQEIKRKEIKLNKTYPPLSDMSADGAASSDTAGDKFGDDLTSGEIRQVKLALAKAIASSGSLAKEFGVTAEVVMEIANEIADRWLLTGEFDRKRPVTHMLNAIGKKLAVPKSPAPPSRRDVEAEREEERRKRREEERIHASKVVSADDYLRSIGVKPGTSMAEIAAPPSRRDVEAEREEERRKRREEERIHASKVVSADDYLRSIGVKPGTSMAEIAAPKTGNGKSELPDDVRSALDSIKAMK